MRVGVGDTMGVLYIGLEGGVMDVVCRRGTGERRGEGEELGGEMDLVSAATGGRYPRDAKEGDVVAVVAGTTVGVGVGLVVDEGIGTLGWLRERGFVSEGGGGVPGRGGEVAVSGSGGVLGLLCMNGL